MMNYMYLGDIGRKEDEKELRVQREEDQAFSKILLFHCNYSRSDIFLPTQIP